MPEGGQDESSSAVAQQDTAEDEVSSAVSPQTEHHSAGVDRPIHQSPETCSPDSVVRDPEVIYDDVPAESLQLPVEGESPDSSRLHYRSLCRNVHTGV